MHIFVSSFFPTRQHLYYCISVNTRADLVGNIIPRLFTGTWKYTGLPGSEQLRMKVARWNVSLTKVRYPTNLLKVRSIPQYTPTALGCSLFGQKQNTVAAKPCYSKKRFYWSSLKPNLNKHFAYRRTSINFAPSSSTSAIALSCYCGIRNSAARCLLCMR